MSTKISIKYPPFLVNKISTFFRQLSIDKIRQLYQRPLTMSTTNHHQFLLFMIKNDFRIPDR